ncbi:MAG TPA: dTDP-4-dehydrorhamnose reductase [bacterium]|nr:dTDP-4-dehydrorhamnose reductase [bacterium]
MARILISGGAGQVGSELQACLSREHEVLAPAREEWDLRKAAIPAKLREFRPDCLINCAAFTKVDLAESERETAWLVNAVAPGRLAEFCYELGIPIFHLSTDYVFDGRKPPPHPYLESDEPAPLSAYGESKLEGERQVHLNAGDWVVLRTAWVYGAAGRNFFKAILVKALRGEPLKVVSDQFGAPTWAATLAAQIVALIGSEAHGVYHASAEGYTTWYEAAVEFLRLMEVEAEVAPCSTAEFPTAALRPANSILENLRLKTEGLNRMRDWRLDLSDFVRRHRAGLMKEARA